MKPRRTVEDFKRDVASKDTPRKSWRDVIKVHPAADMFPLMSAAELKVLAEDIKRHGLKQSVWLWSPKDSKEQVLLDGRNRLDAAELAGIELIRDGKVNLSCYDDLKTYEPFRLLNGGDVEVDPYEYVISANIHRRHLTAEQKRDLIAKLLKAQPEKSNRQIAGTVKADHKTVGAVRSELESTGEIPQLEATVGKDGKARKQPARKAHPDPADDNPLAAGPVTIQDTTASERASDAKGSWRVEATDIDGHTWSSGIRVGSKEEASRYMTRHATIEAHIVLAALRVVRSDDDPNVSFDRNRKGELSRLLFEHGTCGLFNWHPDDPQVRLAYESDDPPTSARFVLKRPTIRKYRTVEEAMAAHNKPETDTENGAVDIPADDGLDIPDCLKRAAS